MVAAVERKKHLVVDAVQAAQCQHLTADGNLAPDDAEIESLAKRVCANFLCAGEQHRHRVGMLCSDDHLLTGLDDAGLFGSDGVDRVAEVGHVIEIDRGDHRDRSLHDIRRVEPPTHAHLDNCDVDGGIGECCERHAGHSFEERQPRLVGRVDEVEEGRDLVVGLHETRWC